MQTDTKNSKKPSSKKSNIPPSVNLVLERHGVLAIVDGEGNLLLSVNAQNLKTSTAESQSTFPNQSMEFHLANAMASSLYQVGGKLETVVQELDMTAAAYYDEEKAGAPFWKVESSIEV